MNRIAVIEQLTKALEAGGYGAAPGTLTGGSALQVEDLSPVMQNVCWQEKALKLQKKVSSETCKSTLAQYDREISYGNFGASAQAEGHVGEEDTGQVVRLTVPMCYYSQLRRATDVSNMVATIDGTKGSDRQAEWAAKVIAGDLEFDLFHGRAHFQNGGFYDGNILAVPTMYNMVGLDVQIRAADTDFRATDQMFAEFGADESVIINNGNNGALQQATVENACMRAHMNHGEASTLYMDPTVLSQYNQIAYTMQRIVYGGAPLESTGSNLRKQATSFGDCVFEPSRFLSGKTSPKKPKSNGPSAPANMTGVSTAISGVNSGFAANTTFNYWVTTGNARGESAPFKMPALFTITTLNHSARLTITSPGSGVASWFNVYRSEANPTSTTSANSKPRFIGRVMAAASGTTVFDDSGQKLPGFVTGYLLEESTMVQKQLAPYSRKKLAETDLSSIEAHFSFKTLCVTQPRKNVVIDGLRGVITA